MKKSILIICAGLITFSIAAYGYINRANTETVSEKPACRQAAVAVNDFLNPINLIQPKLDLVYKVDSRFATRITKEKLHKATSIIDILPEEATQSREAYQYSTVSILHNDGETTEVGQSEVLNTAQLQLLQSVDYSNNIRVTSICKRKDAYTGALIEDKLVYYITVIPEKEAEFTIGQDALIEYLKENSKEKTAIITQDKLRAGQVSFTITKKGTIQDVTLDSTSGFPSVDEVLVEMINNMPEKWEPATNSKGKKVDQELVFFFGLEGC